MNTEYDVAIIGGGTAGLSAALVLARALRRVVVIDANRPRNAPAAHMHGYLSRDGLPPAELLDLGRREVTGYGGELRAGMVTGAVRRSTFGFDLLVDDGTIVAARRLLIATGLIDRVPDIDGIAERWGRDLLHCPYCHGHEVRDQRLGVIGGTPGSVQHALIVRQWSADVTYFDHTTPATDEERKQLAARGIEVVDGTVARLVVENDALAGVGLANGRIVSRDAVFVRPEFAPNTELLRQLGASFDGADWPMTDATGQSSAQGVWVAGNVGNARAQVITAAGEGSAAAIAINNDLVAQDVADALAANHQTTTRK